MIPFSVLGQIRQLLIERVALLELVDDALELLVG